MSKSTLAVAGDTEFKRTPLARAIGQALALTAVAVSTTALAESFPAQISPSDLDGSNGFVIIGERNPFSNPFNGGASSVSTAGDFNGDGITDFIIGNDYANAYTLDPVLVAGAYYDADYAGASYIIFGGADVGSSGTLNLTNEFDGENAFLISGIDEDAQLGRSVSDAGDLNGDGMADLIVGDPDLERSYVVFGGADVSTGVLSLPNLDGMNGFEIDGSSSNYFGQSVSEAGDFNGDGVSDVVIGAPYAGNSSSGESFVVFGGANVGGTGSLDIASLDGSNGFVLNGIDDDDYSGGSVSSAGDFNNDGTPDIIIGALGASPGGNAAAGETYIVFGGAGVGSNGSFDLAALNGSNGFVINGIAAADISGSSVSAAGDVNGDGVPDVIIGAPFADANSNTNAGQSYIVFGGAGVGSSGALNLSTLNGTNGFVINGIDAGDNAGTSVSTAGDVNGDGIADVIIGADFADPGGESYVVFGGAGVGAGGVLELSSLDGTNGFTINGNGAGDSSGTAVGAAGDINGDGLSDIVVSSYVDDNVGFVIFGKQAEISSSDPAPILTCNGLPVTVNLALGQRPTSGDDVIQGTDGADTIRALGGDDTICGLGGSDVINAGSGDDWVDGGASRDIIFGLSGDDILRGRSGADRIFGGSGEDLINGDGGSDFLNGGLGDDLIFGGGGQDGVFGAAGRDVLFGGNGNDSVSGGSGADRINGGGGADNLNGGNGTDECIVDSADSVVSCE